MASALHIIQVRSDVRMQKQALCLKYHICWIVMIDPTLRRQHLSNEPRRKPSTSINPALIKPFLHHVILRISQSLKSFLPPINFPDLSTGSLEKMSTAISTSAKGASYLILLQISSRAFTFLINQIILRYSSPERLGLSTQLELYVITVLYFARESVRIAVQRQASRPQVVVNLSYFAILLGIPLSAGLGWAWLQRDLPAIPYVREALVVCAVASVVELLSEPGFVIAQQRLLYGVRASVETTATILSCLVRLAVVVGSTRAGVDLGVNSFAAGQFTYAATLLVMYGWNISGVASKEKFSFFLTKLTEYVLLRKWLEFRLTGF